MGSAAEAIALIDEAQSSLKELNKLNRVIQLIKSTSGSDRRAIISALLPCLRVIRKKVTLANGEGTEKISAWLFGKTNDVYQICMEETHNVTTALLAGDKSSEETTWGLQVFYFRAAFQALLARISFKSATTEDVHSSLLDSEGDFTKTLKLALQNQELPAVGKGFVEEDLFPYRDMLFYVMAAISKIVQKVNEEAEEKRNAGKKAKSAGRRANGSKDAVIHSQEEFATNSGLQEQGQIASRKRKRSGNDFADVSLEAASALLLGITHRREQSLRKTERFAVLHHFDASHKLLSLLSDEAIKKTLSRAWVSLFASDLPADALKELLLALKDEIFPAMRESDALRLSDFLTMAYDQGGLLAVLSLSSLFHLMSKYNLDYPNFYPKLFSVMDVESFYLKHRKRLITMATMFLRSSLLPGALAAGFVKKMAFNTLHTPSHIALVFAPIMHNILRRHPMAQTLFHAEDSKKSGSFDFDATDPQKSNAEQTSVYELSLLRQHYLPHVRKSVEALSQKPLEERDLELIDANEVSYQRLFEEETRRKIRTGSVAFKMEETLFSADVWGDFVGKNDNK